MQEVTQSMCLPMIKERFADPESKSLCSGVFPLDNPKNTRFAINYLHECQAWTHIEEMREHLKVSIKYARECNSPVTTVVRVCLILAATSTTIFTRAAFALLTLIPLRRIRFF